MKKWVERDWSELRSGDIVRYFVDPDFSYKIEHIGNDYFKTEAYGKPWLAIRKNFFGPERYQRLEEVEPPDGWYLVEYDGEEMVRYKHGKYMYSNSNLDQRGCDWEEYVFIKRVEFKDLEDQQ